MCYSLILYWLGYKSRDNGEDRVISPKDLEKIRKERLAYYEKQETPILKKMRTNNEKIPRERKRPRADEDHKFETIAHDWCH